jgi:pimeloyl-ACP methyl ester carboxylesterase
MKEQLRGKALPFLGSRGATARERKLQMLRIPRSLSLAAAAFLLIVGAAQAHLVIFKDGFIIIGELKRTGEVISDDAGGGIWVPKSTFFLEDGPRRILFGHSQVQDVMEQNPNQDAEKVKAETPISRLGAKHMYPILQIVDAPPWDDNWKRLFKFMAPHGRVDARQRLSILTPQYARVDNYNLYWSMFYDTKELGLNTVQSLLSTSPELKLHGDQTDVARHFRIYRFLAQAGWYEAAEEELAKIVKEFPGEKNKVDAAREDMKKVQNVQLYEDIQLAHQAGRHAWVQQHLVEFPNKGMDEKLLATIRSLKTSYETTSENLAQARKFLQSLPRGVDSTLDRQMFTEAAAAILEELAPENVGRLEPFLTMAQQAERDRAKDHKPAHDSAQLLSLAVSGWLLGKESAEAKVETAHRLWRARQFVLEYERTDSVKERDHLRSTYEARRTDALPIDELSQLIAFLPPPFPKAELRAEPMTFQLKGKDGRRESRISYVVQLPPEYHAGRAYPVVFALHPHREKPEITLSRIAPEAGKHGYIVVAPEWTRPLEDEYGYTAQEHAAVLDVLRDLRRRFPIDSDRVFLLGLQLGGNMAWDVGMAHPDQFAGVVVMGAQPHYFANRYWPNAQYLPFYVVDGQYAAKNSEYVHPILDKWMPLGYPALYVEYRGRGLEWFRFELPHIFDWMDHKVDQKKRATAVPGHPLGEKFRTMRQGDNRFYWLSTNALKDVCLNDASEWKNERVGATLEGHISEGNQIHLNVRGVKDVTVWLGRDMIDFTKPLTVRINGGLVLTNRKVTPSLSTLLEDLYERGDRQRVYWAKLPFRGL